MLQITLDGVHTDLTPGFPEVEEEVDGIDIIVRFSTFQSSASYGLFIKQDRRSPEQVLKDKKNAETSRVVMNLPHSSGQLRNHFSCTFLMTCFLYNILH